MQNTKGEVVEELGELLVEAGMQNVLPLPKARVPVVKFVVGENGTKVNNPRQMTANLLMRCLTGLTVNSLHLETRLPLRKAETRTVL